MKFAHGIALAEVQLPTDLDPSDALYAWQDPLKTQRILSTHPKEAGN